MSPMGHYGMAVCSLVRGYQWRTQELFSGGGVQQIQLRTEDRTGIWGAVAP